MSYQGPNVSVTQVFETTPPVVNVENLPSVAIGSAYEVHAQEQIGQGEGILATVVYPWVLNTSGNPVLYQDSVAGRRNYERYPVNVYANSAFGTFPLTPTGKSASGITLGRDATFQYYASPSNLSGVIMPYSAVTSGSIVLDPTTQGFVTCANSQFVAAGLQVGMEVVGNDAGTYVLLGTVNSFTPTSITLATPSTAVLSTHGSGNTLSGLYVGAGKFLSSGDFSSIKSRPAYLYDPNNKFNGTQIGDVISISSPGLSSTISQASIDSVFSNGNMVRFYCDAATQPNQSNFLGTTLDTYIGSTSTASMTPIVTSYNLNRFVGFTAKYVTTGITVVTHANGSNQVALSGGSYNQGDELLFQHDTVSYGVIRTITIADNTNHIYTLDSIPANAVTTGDDIYAYMGSSTTANVSENILADYRAAQIDKVGTVFRSGDNQLTGTNGLFGISSVYNDLAFQCDIISGVNAGRVMYAYAIDPTQSALTQYEAANEALSFFDVYSHNVGTDDAGVNALYSPYVNGQADPYEGHERVATLCYNPEDVFTLGQDSVTGVSAGTFSITGDINLITIGLAIGDTVRFTATSTPDIQTDYTVLAMPTASSVLTNAPSTVTSAGSARFMAGHKSKQASMIAALGLGDRRIKALWPGNFKADVPQVGTIPAAAAVTLPGYFLTALRAGMDGGQKVSQSATRLVTALPGLSNIQLGTSSYWRKSDLDIIGGGGIDIMVQDNPVSNTIYSRHDLTTDMSAVETREWSVTKQADQAAKTLRNSTNPYIGKFNITPQLLKFLSLVANGVSTSLTKNSVVSQFQILSIAQDPNVVDKVNFLTKTTVFIAGNYYDITMLVVSK